MSSSSFRSLFDAGSWASIDWIHLSLEEQVELLQRLREVVPRIPIENGMERTTRFAFPNEVGPDRHLRAAALIIYEGELEAQFEGSPPPASKAWKETLASIRRHLQEMMSDGEVTKGDHELGRLRHIENAIEHLSDIEFEISFLRKQCTNENEGDWIVEGASSIAELAFNAGRRFQAAWSKSFEEDAVRGEKVAGGSKNSAHETNSVHKLLRERRLTRLKELGFPSTEQEMPQMTLAAACKICTREGLGSVAAVRQTYHRWK